jgi:hypothetical protein
MLPLLAWLVAGPATVPTVDAPVTSVTVYSYRAQVTRTAALTLSGRTAVAFPLLPTVASAASIRLEAVGAEVETIAIAPVTEDELPVDEARALLDALDKLDRQIALGEAEHQTLIEIHDAADDLVPVAPEVGAHAPAPRLDPSGWTGAMGFLSASIRPTSPATARRRACCSVAAPCPPNSGSAPRPSWHRSSTWWRTRSTPPRSPSCQERSTFIATVRS